MPFAKNTSQFEKDLKLAYKRGKDLSKVKYLMKLLEEAKSLPVESRNHKLKGEYAGLWECHIEPDWLLIYSKTKTEIIFYRTGTHADLF